MSIFDLFRKSEWNKLQTFTEGVQRDVGNLIALDSMSKAAVSEQVSRLQEAPANQSIGTYSDLVGALSEQRIMQEIRLAILSTGVGKEFTALTWNCLPPARAVGFLGILAMCEYRNSEQLTVQNDLKHSGYSAHPDEARTQLIVLLANHLSISELNRVRQFDNDVFRKFWLALRKTLFIDIQLASIGERSGLPLGTKERFAGLSAPRKQIVLLFAEALAKNEPNGRENAATPKKPAAKFDLARSQAEHPFKYVPYTKLIYQMQALSREIALNFSSLEIQESELTRMIGAEGSIPSTTVAKLVELDSDIAAYCMTVAAVMSHETTFVGCGVWKKLTEFFEAGNQGRMAVAALTKISRLPQRSDTDLAALQKRAASLALTMQQEIRQSATNYRQAGRNDKLRLEALLAGTQVLKHVLKNPRYGRALEKHLRALFVALDPKLVEIKSGELLIWDQQKLLVV